MMLDLNRVLEQIEKDKSIPRQSLIEAIESAMMSAARKKLGFLGDLEAHFNPEAGEVELFQFKTVVETVTDSNREIIYKEAKKLDPDCSMGDSIGTKISADVLGRIAAQTAKQVIIQKLRDAEKDIVVNEYKDRMNTVLSGVVRRFEKGNLIVDLGKAEAVVPYKEQIPGEAYKPGDRIQAYFVHLDDYAHNGALVVLSRRHPQFLKALFEMEVPEISEGIVEIKSCAREPGVRAKIAVYSKDDDVDPVGACVGMKGSRVQSVVQELRGEKIDIVLWDEDSAKFVCNAIAPAEVSKVIIKENEKSMEIIVPDDQLSLAIGRKGQNVRLAANLTGWNIDIFSESKIDEMAKQAKARLSEFLDIDESIATILYSHAYRSVEEIAGVSEEEFISIPGMDQDALKRIYAKAGEVLKEAKSEKKSDAIVSA
ncbi:MAG TPA: transcription termination/antitermination protein NusA [Deltaproteobacteria bacterium]|nr:MAG: transcription termination/antitermination protein NusA [Deltaproteobacteria bacterium GWA2_45_12]HBF12978.1 transcription termination/antitermination protein NusA [Deltaproteobacteria bacterium]